MERPEDPRPQVNIQGIEKLSWTTRKKIVEEEACVVTKFSFEGEVNANQIGTVHNLLKGGGPLTVTITSPQLMMDLQLKEAQEKAQKEQTEQ